MLIVATFSDLGADSRVGGMVQFAVDLRFRFGHGTVQVRHGAAEKLLDAIGLNLSKDVAHGAEHSHLGFDLQNEPLQYFAFVGVLGIEKRDGRRLGLAVAVDTAVALLHPVRVPRQLEVNQVMAVLVQVETFSGNVGGDQDARFGGGKSRESEAAVLARAGVAREADHPPFIAAAFQVGHDGVYGVGVLAEYDDLFLGMQGVQGFEPAFEREQFGLGSCPTGVNQLFELVEPVRFVLQAAKFAARALHGGEVAAVEVTFETRLSFFGDGFAAANRAQVVAADLDFRDGLRDVLPALGDRFPDCRERRCGALAENRGDQADGLPVGPERFLRQQVQVGRFLADGGLELFFRQRQLNRQRLHRHPLDELGRAVRAYVHDVSGAGPCGAGSDRT